MKNVAVTWTPATGFPSGTSQLYAHGVRSLARRRRFGRKFNLQLLGCLLGRTRALLTVRACIRSWRFATALRSPQGSWRSSRCGHQPSAPSVRQWNRRASDRFRSRAVPAIPALVDECDLSRACLQNARSRNHELPAERRGDVDVDVHAGLQRNARIAQDQPDAHGSRCWHPRREGSGRCGR